MYFSASQLFSASNTRFFRILAGFFTSYVSGYQRPFNVSKVCVFFFEGILEKEHVFDAFTDGDDLGR